MKLQNLFFKLNVDKPEYKDVYDFFNNEADTLGISKIELLKRLIALYRFVGKLPAGTCKNPATEIDLIKTLKGDKEL